MIRTHQQFIETKHFAGLDGLRCVAIIAVIWHHTVQDGWLPMLDRGYLGVDLFFVLSGFLITTLLLREKANQGRICLKQFWARRFLRLMPAYYGMLIALVVGYGLLKPNDPNTAALIDGLPVYALYLSNWFNPGANNLDPLWSLATEEQFYLVWPLVEAFLMPATILVVGILALLINQLVNFGILDGAIMTGFGISPDQHPEILQSTFTPILLGVAVAHLLNNAHYHKRIASILGSKFAPAIAGLLLFVSLNIPAADISGLLRLSLHILMAIFIASIVLVPASPVTKALDWRAARYLGTISYGMYLFHLWCVFAVSKVLAKLNIDLPILLFVGTLISTLFVSTLSYRFFEKRFLDLRHRFRPNGGS